MDATTPLLGENEGRYGTSDGSSDGLSPQALSELIRSKQLSALSKLGGPTELATKLNSNASTGFHKDFPIEQRRKEYGANYIAPPPETTYCELIWAGLQDTTLIMLLASAVISLILGLGVEKDFDHGWIEGVSILLSVAVVLNVQAGTDYSKAAEFRRQQLELESNQHVELLRGGEAHKLSPKDVVVGDVLRFGVGDILPVDGILLEGSDVKMDESALTGEPNLIPKSVDKDPFLLSGTNVMSGSGKVVVVAVGVLSVQGSILDTVGNSEAVSTEGGTLVEKLDDFAVLIGKGGSAVALVTFIIMIIKWSTMQFIFNTDCKDLAAKACDALQQCSFSGDSCTRQWTTGTDLSKILNFFVTAITILVVAIPEGLPLAVTLSLAVSIGRMTKDNNQVKHMDSCETMGSATTICSDKTGTLTMNRMNVVRCFVASLNLKQQPGDGVKIPELLQNEGSIGKAFVQRLSQAAILNSSSVSKVVAADGGKYKYFGNATECALIKMAQELGFDSETMRSSSEFVDPSSPLNDWGTHVFPFSSERKRMSTVVPVKVAEEIKSYRLYSKGAPDYILQSSVGYLAPDGKTVRQLTESSRDTWLNAASEYQKAGLRVLALGYRDFKAVPKGGWNCVDGKPRDPDKTEPGPKDAENDLVLIGFFGIEDPLRPEVITAIKKCNKAGVDVRMCTGDALTTAVSISLQAGILRPKDMNGDIPKENFAMTGPEFRSHIEVLDDTKPKRIRKVYDAEQGKVVEKLSYPVKLDLNGDKIVDQSKLDEIWPKLRVLARCQPEDKLTLVKGMKESMVFADAQYCAELKEKHDIDIFPDHQVVAVTGDGTNDAPALKIADVGFAMGIVGTDTAKQACDILLMDDNFASIVQAIKWGRNVYDSISKFIQFQLTVNVVAIIVAVIGALRYNESPLSAVQMLWINLIMDSLASLALATEPPTDALLDRKPYGKRRRMLSRVMYYNIFGQATYQLVVLIIVLFFPSVLPGEVMNNSDVDTSTFGSVHWTILFNVFVQMQLFNELNSRKLQTVMQLKETWSEWNVFLGIAQNKTFIAVVVSTAVLQVGIIQYGGAAFKLAEGGLTLQQWLFCLIVGAMSIVWQLIINLALVTVQKQDEDEVVRVRPSRAEAQRRWKLVQDNMRYGGTYARLFGTDVKDGMLVSRLTLARRGANRPNYAYPSSKHDSLRTQKIIRRLGQKVLSMSDSEGGAFSSDELSG